MIEEIYMENIFTSDANSSRLKSRAAILNKPIQARSTKKDFSFALTRIE
jgi:hypothetical protein